MGVNRTNTDQFQLRLPPGLRERVKAYADKHNRSMNAEIVRLLEREFPEPVALEDRVVDLLELVDALKDGAKEESVEKLTLAIEQTLKDIASGRLPAREDFDRDEIIRGLQHWQTRKSEEAMHQFTANLDEDEDWPYRGVDPFKG